MSFLYLLILGILALCAHNPVVGVIALVCAFACSAQRDRANVALVFGIVLLLFGQFIAGILGILAYFADRRG